LSEIHFPLDVKLKLTTLDLGYNDLVELPDSMDQLTCLRTLRLANNFLSVVPMRICCHESLNRLDVTSNPVRTPPLDVCERGVHAMKRFYVKAKTTP
jgi:hypothetical protein